MEKDVDGEKWKRTLQECSTMTSRDSPSARMDEQSTWRKRRTNHRSIERATERIHTNELRNERTDGLTDKKVTGRTNRRKNEWHSKLYQYSWTASRLIQGLPMYRKALASNVADDHDWLTVFCFFYFPFFRSAVIKLSRKLLFKCCVTWQITAGCI